MLLLRIYCSIQLMCLRHSNSGLVPALDFPKYLPRRLSSVASTVPGVAWLRSSSATPQSGSCCALTLPKGSILLSCCPGFSCSPEDGHKLPLPLCTLLGEKMPRGTFKLSDFFGEVGCLFADQPQLTGTSLLNQ